MPQAAVAGAQRIELNRANLAHITLDQREPAFVLLQPILEKLRLKGRRTSAHQQRRLELWIALEKIFHERETQRAGGAS
jgi:hypothetical protein